MAKENFNEFRVEIRANNEFREALQILSNKIGGNYSKAIRTALSAYFKDPANRDIYNKLNQEEKNAVQNDFSTKIPPAQVPDFKDLEAERRYWRNLEDKYRRHPNSKIYKTASDNLQKTYRLDYKAELKQREREAKEQSEPPVKKLKKKSEAKKPEAKLDPKHFGLENYKQSVLNKMSSTELNMLLIGNENRLEKSAPGSIEQKLLKERIKRINLAFDN